MPGRRSVYGRPRRWRSRQPARRPRPATGSPTIRLFGGLPDPALFPRARWLRHYRSALAEVPDPDLTYPNMLGTPSLRATLTAYLGRVRGVATAAQRVLVCSGYTQGLALVCRALRRRGVRRIAVEDPCFAHHRQAIAMTGLEPVPVPVDREGLDPGQLPSRIGAISIARAHFPMDPRGRRRRSRAALAGTELDPQGGENRARTAGPDRDRLRDTSATRSTAAPQCSVSRNRAAIVQSRPATC
jgi:DNA-binding transcriptional MocR family regulator